MKYPPPATTELLFIKDAALRDNIRRDLRAVNRALNNAEWKAATVLSGATIEALFALAAAGAIAWRCCCSNCCGGPGGKRDDKQT